MAYEETDKLEIPITKLQWGLRGAQIFFAFLAMACIIAVIVFDNKTTSSSIIDNIFVFFVILSMFMSAAIVGIPYTYMKYGKFKSLARALRIIRIEFVLTAIWAVILFLISIAVSVEMGLKNCDYSASQYSNATSNSTSTRDMFIDGLSGRCRTARAGNAFGWFSLAVWLGSLGLIAQDWRKNRRQPLPKHDFHRDEITMHTSSSKSSLDASGGAGFKPPQGSQSPYQENVQMENIHTFAANSSQQQQQPITSQQQQQPITPQQQQQPITPQQQQQPITPPQQQPITPQQQQPIIPQQQQQFQQQQQQQFQQQQQQQFQPQQQQIPPNVGVPTSANNTPPAFTPPTNPVEFPQPQHYSQ